MQLGFSIILRGAGDRNFFPLHSSMHTALLLRCTQFSFQPFHPRIADPSPFGFLSHNQSGWIAMEVVNMNIYSQNSGSFVPINMCYLSALGTGFTQQKRHESHCSQPSAVCYYLQHRVDSAVVDVNSTLSSPETHDYTALRLLLRGINTVISISIPSHALHFGTQR